MKLIKIDNDYFLLNDNPITGKMISNGTAQYDKSRDAYYAVEASTKDIFNIPFIDKSKIELLTGGYQLEKLASKHCEEQNRLGSSHDFYSFIAGYKNGNFFTLEDINKAINFGFEKCKTRKRMFYQNSSSRAN